MDKSTKEQIDEALAPRIDDYETYQAAATEAPFVVGSADLLYVFDQYHQQFLDFAGGLLHPVGHRNDPVKTRVAEQLAHHGHTAPQGQHVARWPVEYAKMLSSSLERPEGPLQVLYCDSEKDARLLGDDISTYATGTSVFLDLIDDSGRPTDPHDIQLAVDRAKRCGQTVVVDESKIGFGRLGTFWGHERYNIDPDIIIVGGPAGGGFPFGAVLAPAGSFEIWHENKTVSPTAGHPAICAAGAQTMLEINAGVLAHVEDAGHALNTALRELATQFPHVVHDVRGAGLLQVMECQGHDMTYDFWDACLHQGLMLNAPRGNLIELTPPLITSENELRRGVDMMAAAALTFE